MSWGRYPTIWSVTSICGTGWISIRCWSISNHHFDSQQKIKLRRPAQAIYEHKIWVLLDIDQVMIDIQSWRELRTRMYVVLVLHIRDRTWDSFTFLVLFTIHIDTTTLIQRDFWNVKGNSETSKGISRCQKVVFSRDRCFLVWRNLLVKLQGEF